MKADWFGWPIVVAVVLGLLFSGAEQTWAGPITVVDFEDLGVAFGTQDTYEPGVGVVSRGFYYTPDPLNGDSFNDLHISNEGGIQASNGTTVGATHNEGILTKEYGGTFSLQRFDFAGFPTDKEVSFTVTGDHETLPDITQSFKLISLGGTVDGKVDGVDGVVDFQTFYLGSDWTNLVSVRWTHTGYGTNKGLFALDNIVVNKYTTVPEPSTITLLGLGILCLLGQGWRCRKQV
jgi:hypothetical protein